MSSPPVPMPAEQQRKFKQEAAETAAALVESGMRVGLGTGSTAIFATRRLALLLRQGCLKDIIGFATSKAVWHEARQLGISLMDEEMPLNLDLTIDGADEVDPGLDLIKGGGGALLREKIVAQSSARVVIAVDETKLSPRLGTHFPVPVEVLAFGLRSHERFLESLGAAVHLRRNPDGSAFTTDSGNLILDCAFGPIADAPGLDDSLSARAGVVEHGLFVQIATDVIVAGKGGIRHMKHETPGGGTPASANL